MSYLQALHPQAVHVFESLLVVGAFGFLLWLGLLLARPLTKKMRRESRYAGLLVLQLLMGISLPASLLLVPIPAEITSVDGAQDVTKPAFTKTVSINSGNSVDPATSTARVATNRKAVLEPPVLSLLHQLERSPVWASAPYVTIAYMLMVVLLLVRLVIGVARGEALRLRSEPIEDGFMLATISRQARRMGLHYVPAFASCEVAGPCVIGFLRPMLLLPLSLLGNIPPEHVEMIIAHEIAHIRRYDPLISLMQRMVEAFLFFHPVVWYLSKQIHLERECCCDDMVLKGGPAPHDYAAVLVNLARLVLERIQLGQISGTMQAQAFTGRPSELGQRVARLLDIGLDGVPLRDEPVRLARRSVLALLGITALFCGIVVESALASSHRSPPLPSVVLFKGMESIHEAAAIGTPQQLDGALLNWPVDQPTRQGWSALEIAAAVGRLDIMQDLLSAGANPNYVDHQGRTPLFAAVGMGPTAALDVAPTGRTDVICVLLSHGANVTCRDHSGMTILDAAVVRGLTGATSLLLASGADTSPRDNFGRTAVLYACEGMKPQTLGLLMKARADVHVKDDRGRDCLDAVALQPEARGPQLADIAACAALLRNDLHLDLCSAVALGDVDEVKEILAHRSPELAEKDFTYSDYSPLCWAVTRDNPQLVQILLQAGANPNYHDALSKAIHHAASIGPSILSQMLHAGANLNARDNKGLTALHEAMAESDLPTIKLLLDAGANPQLTNAKGLTPAECISDEVRPEQRASILKLFAACPVKN